LIPVLVWLLSHKTPGPSAAAAAVVVTASLSDFFDGYLARRYGASSTLGKLLDPLADKLITVSALIMLAAMDREPRVPAWMVVVIVGRELAVTGLRAIALGEGIVLAAQELGKYKMIFQIFALAGLSVHYTYFHVDFFVCGIYFLWISLVTSVWSGVEYHLKVLAAVRAARRRPQTPAA